MPVVIYECWDSQSATISTNDPTCELKYIITGASDVVTADAALVGFAPPNVLDLLANGRTISPLGGGVWIGTVNYGVLQSTPADGQGDTTTPPPPAPPAPGEDEHLSSAYSFDTTGNTQHITQSIVTIARAAIAGVTAPEFNGAIAVSKNGVGGTDRIVPKFEFSLTVTMKFLTIAYIRILRDLTGTLNNVPMWTFAAGELLFLGASGAGKTGEIGWPITYKFLTAKNRASVVIVPDPLGVGPPLLELTGVGGHDFIWVGYEDAIDANQLIQKPIYAFSERVYEYGDFTLMGIGGA